MGGTGTITGNVTIQSGAALEWNATPLAIVGNLTFSGNAVIRPVAGFLPVAGTYVVATYSGTLTGNPVFSWEPPVGSNLVATFSTATGGQITLTLTQPLRSPGPIVWTAANGFIWDSATVNWTAGGLPTNFITGDTPTFTDSGLATSAINLVANVEPASVVIDSTQNYTFSGTGAITGTASLVKSGSGALTVSAAHTFEGGTTIEGGSIAISNASSLGTGAVTLDGGTWAMGSLAPLNSVIVESSSSVSGGSSGGTHAIKNISGSGDLTINATSVFDLEGDISGFSGNLYLTGVGSVRFFSTSNNGSSAAAFHLGTRSLSARSGNAFNIGALHGLAGSILSMASNSSSANCTYTIGGRNEDSTFAGVIANGSSTKPISIIKTGNGNLTLAGINTYTGATAINAGKITVTGALGATPTSVGVSGTLAGSGSIAGAVTCNGTLAPGASIGSLSLGAGLVMGSTSALEIDLGSSSDLVAVTGNLTLDGTVNLNAAAGFGPGTYTISTYTGTLTNNTLNIGSVPVGYNAAVNTSTAGQVRLVIVSANLPPVISIAASAPPSNVTTTNTAVSVSATDDGGEPNISYTWAAVGSSAVTFSPNGTNSAKNSTATFSGPGTYLLEVTVTDAPGLSSTSSTSVMVEATSTNIVISPASATVPVGENQSFTAIVSDQFGAIVSNPVITWDSTGSGGQISPSGIYTATAAGGPWQVTATSGSLSGSSVVTVSKGVATVNLGNLTNTYDGSAKPVLATTVPANLNLVITYDLLPVAPTLPGTYAVSAVVDDPNYAGGNNGSLVIAQRNFTSWESSHFTPEQITAGLSAMDADPDTDGLTNLAEYALGTQPFGFTPQPGVTRGPDSVSITFQRPAHIGDVTYHAEASTGLDTWEQITLEVLNPGSDPETVRATYPLTVPNPDSSFLRLRFVR